MDFQVERQAFHSSTDEGLVWVCFKPIITTYKAMMRENETIGRDGVVAKVQFYRELTPGQQALFMYCSYHHHAIESQAEFYWWSAYFIAQPMFWTSLKKAVQYFEEDTMLLLLEEIEKIFTSQHDTHHELDDKLMFAAISPLDQMFHQFAPATLQRIGARIRQNPSAFVQIVDEAAASSTPESLRMF
ncbi:hypothetical protein [Paenibacillus guangzhouensis]|uniref:hypothetical protein n=1 Tax=Paenibacillus guangzhouensis TaxID=1473112 RepID=UPI0012677BDA|nr:hypothetical protein [Paenibacillus guangzhouensis]